MPVETPPYVNTFNPLWPQDSDTVSEGAAHIRNMKIALLASFPNVTGPVTATQAVLNGADARVTLLEANRARRDIGDTFAGAMVFNSTIDALGAISSASSVSSATTINGTVGVHQAGALLVPPGVISMYGGAAAPAGYLLCNGAAVSRATYAALFAVVSTTFGVGDGTTTFNTPNMTDRYPVGVGTVARGATAGSLTPAVVVASGGSHWHGGVTSDSGAHTHGGVVGSTALTEAQMPSHIHHVNDPGHLHGLGANALTDSGGGSRTTTFDTSYGLVSQTQAAATGIYLSYTGGSAGHSHTIATDPGHSHTIASDAGHTHTASIADGRPPSLGVQFVIKT